MLMMTVDRDRDVDLAVLGRRLRAARQSAGLTQEQLAARLGWAQVRISEFERGQINFGIASIFQISEALGVTPGSLVDFEEFSSFEIDTNT